MAPRVDLKQGEFAKHIARALKSLRDGYVIIAPLEHGYIYLADAFSPFAVRAMHVLRGDELGISAQVLGYNAQMIQGITRDISEDAKVLMNNFWPGQLSLTVKPNRSLAWDLGDDKRLDQVNVRVPKSRFIRSLVKVSGPLAVASASHAGQPQTSKIDRALVKNWDVAVVFDAGTLKSGPPTTIVEEKSDGLHVIREGAVSVAQLKAFCPAILASNY